MKKFLALFLALIMALSLVACGGTGDSDKDDGNDTNPPADNGGDTNPPADGGSDTENPPADGGDDAGPVMADPEEITVDPIYYKSFEDTEGLAAVHRVDKSQSPEADAANYGIAPSVHEIMLAPGVDGQALAVDGKYGVSFTDVPTTADDTYTIAFWYAADRYGLYMPILQMGRNVGGTTNSTYLNFTRTNWGIGGVDCAPIVWSRNSDTNPSNPWIGNNVDERGKKEWIHVALVVDGVEYNDADPTNGPCPHVGATVYVNGVQVMKADASVIGTTDEAGMDTSANWMGVAPHMIDSTGAYGLECYFGINYWDSLFKGYMDEFYIYDDALTPGQIATLYTKFSAPEYEKFPDYTGPMDEDGATEPEAPTLPEITPDANALAVLGTPAYDLGFWTDHTASYEIPADGTTVTFKLNNYSDGTQNYRNFYNVFCSIPMEASNVDPNTMEGYVEYGVIRADSWDFGTGNPDGSGNYERSWADDWAGWLAKMTDVEVTVAVSRTGPSVNLEYTYTCADGSTMTAKAVVELPKMTDDMPCYGFIGGEGAYIELLSVE